MPDALGLPSRFGLRLNQPRLTVTRCLWAAVVILGLITFAMTIPIRYGQLVSVAQENRPFLTQLNLTTVFLIAYLIAFDTMAMLGFCLTAAVIAWRKFDDWLALFASAMLVLMGVLVTRPVESLTAVILPWRFPFVLTLALGISAIILFMFLFPDGRFAPAWSRWLAFGWLVWVFGWYLLPLILIQPMPWPPRLQPGWAVLGWVGSGLGLQIYRFRAVSSSAQRQQTKWVLLGLLASALGFMFYLYLAPASLPALRQPGLPQLLYILLGVPVLYFSLLLLPLTIAISILRYRLWDIGVLVNRTVVYAVLTLLLTAVYLALVLILQPFFRSLTNHNSLPVIAASTLATAVLFYPLRQRVQASIDRRIFPRKYDAAQVLAALSVSLRGEVDMTRLTEALESAVYEALQPASVLCWLHTSSSYRVYLFDATPEWINGEVFGDDPLLAYLQQADHDVVHLDVLHLTSPALDHFKAANVSVLMLLRSRGELIGWLSLGPRLSEQGYSADDLNFLGLVAAQAGPAIRVAQMAQEQQAAALAQQHLRQQLDVARLVQQTLLPHHWPELPGWQVAAHYRPAQAIGGDFYDFLSFKDGRLGLIIGDVSDKGIPAALLMAATRSLLRSVAYQFVSPGDVLARANRLLLPDLPEGLFVTCLYAVLDPANGRLLLANAGHNPPSIRTASGVSEPWLTGMPLGWLPHVTYEERELFLEQGDCVLFYSDGLTEAMNENGELLGTLNLQTLFSQTTDTGSQLIDFLLQEAAAFSGQNNLEDDVTIVTLHRELIGAKA